jgi:dTDP-L-rhamnose 4-epimerase
VTIKDLASKLAEGLSSSVKPTISNEGRVGDVRHCIADISKLKKLGYVHLHPTLDIQTLIEWSKTINAVDKFDDAKKELDIKIKK